MRLGSSDVFGSSATDPWILFRGQAQEVRRTPVATNPLSEGEEKREGASAFRLVFFRLQGGEAAELSEITFNVRIGFQNKSLFYMPDGFTEFVTVHCDLSKP